jgi:hypothetical protein
MSRIICNSYGLATRDTEEAIARDRVHSEGWSLLGLRRYGCTDIVQILDFQLTDPLAAEKLVRL